MNAKSLKRITKRFVTLLLILLVVGLFALPRVAKLYLVKNSNELIGRELELDKLRINYLNGKLKIIGFQLFEENSTGTFVSLKKLTVNIKYWPFLKNELVVDEILLDNFYCQVEQNGASFNFSDLIPETDTIPSETLEDTIPSDRVLTVKRIAVMNSNLHYYDKQLDHTISIDDLSLNVPEFSVGKGQAFVSLSFDLANGGGLSTDFNYNQTDSTYLFHLKLDSINLNILEPYIKDALAVSAVDGYFSNEITLNGSAQHVSQVVATGWNRIDGFQLTDEQNRKILSFQKLLIAIDSIDAINETVKIREIRIQDPYVLLEMIDSSNNWLALIKDDYQEADTLTMDTSATVDGGANQEASFLISVFVLDNGKVDFTDLSTTPVFTTSIHTLNVTSANVANTGQNIELNMFAGINNSAEITSRVVINPAQPEDILADLSVIKFALKDIEPYLMHYFGYPVESGFLNFSTQNVLSAQTMHSENNLYVRKFNLGDANKENAVYKVPLNMALGVLSDKKGEINIDLPVHSEGDDTQLGNLGKLIVKTFTNLLIKAATSPANMLAQMYGVNPDKIKELKIGMFSSMPEADDVETLDIIASILTDKPQLKAELNYTLNKEVVTDSIAKQKVVEDYRKTYASATTSIADSSLVQYLTAHLSITDSLSLSQLCKAFVGEAILKQQYDSIVIKHTDFVNDYLRSYEGLPETNFTIQVDSIQQTNQNKDYGVFTINFVMK